MKRNVLLGIILSGSSLTIFAQSSDIEKPITITTNVSVQNFDWLERSTVGNVGVQIQVKPTKSLNISVNGNAFKSLGNSTSSGLNEFSTSAFNDKSPAVPVFNNNNNGAFGSVNATVPKTNYQGAFINIDA